MTRIKFDYIHEFVDRHGKVRRYVRLHGKRTPLPGLPGSPEFLATYEAAIAGQQPPKMIGSNRTVAGTINALIIEYYQSGSFTRALSPGTQHARRIRLEKFRSLYGEKHVATLSPAAIDKIIARHAATPFEAQNLFKALRGLMKHAKFIGLRTDDPTAHVERPKVHSDGFHTWTEGEIRAFEGKHSVGTRARLAFALLLFTAQRRGDVIRIGRQHVHDGVLHLTQRKAGAVLKLPVHPELAAIIAATPTTNLTFLTTHAGRPFTDAGFGNLFRDWCRDAGLPEHCSAHGLRKAACRRLAEAGASANVIAAISGHKTLREVERYTKAADQARMARAGMDLMTAVRETAVSDELEWAKK